MENLKNQILLCNIYYQGFLYENFTTVKKITFGLKIYLLYKILHKGELFLKTDTYTYF